MLDEIVLRKKRSLLSFLRRRMKEKKISSYELHKRTGIAQSSLSRYFGESMDMSFNNYLKICHALDLSIYLIPREIEIEEIDSSINTPEAETVASYLKKSRYHKE